MPTYRTQGKRSLNFLSAARQDSFQVGHREMISQGFSGGPGFYLGHTPSHTVRATDSWNNTGVSFPSDGTFYHFALVVDVEDSSSRLYVDGLLKATFGSAITTTNGGTHTRFGTQFQSGEWFHGALDEVKIWDRALSEGEVGALALYDGLNMGPAVSGFVANGGIGLAEMDPSKYVDVSTGDTEVRFAPITSGGIIDIQEVESGVIEARNEVIRTYAAMYAQVTLNNLNPDQFQAGLKLHLSEEDLTEIYAAGFTEMDLRIYVTTSIPIPNGFSIPLLSRSGWTDDLMEEMESVGYGEPDSEVGHWGFEPIEKYLWVNVDSFSAYAIGIPIKSVPLLSLPGLFFLIGTLGLVGGRGLIKIHSHSKQSL
jgi:hypothetical protein